MMGRWLGGKVAVAASALVLAGCSDHRGQDAPDAGAPTATVAQATHGGPGTAQQTFTANNDDMATGAAYSVLGAAPTMCIGTVGATELGDRTRWGLIDFNVNPLPNWAVVTDVTVTLQGVACNVCGNSNTLTLHRVTQNWSENGSGAGSTAPCNQETAGTAGAIAHVAGASSSLTTASQTGAFVFPSTPALVADVQAWIGGATMEGWVIKGSTTASQLKRLATRENGALAAPTLVVTYRGQPNGANCTAAGQCDSGHCVSRVSGAACSGGSCVCCGEATCQSPPTCKAFAGTCGATCDYTGNAPNGSSCNDGLFCNGADTCSAGACAVHAGDPCSGTQCNTCNESADNCFTPVGTGCNDGLACNVGETCNGAGACAGGAAPDCSGFSDFCNDGVCSEPGGCRAQPKSPAPTCASDGNVCTQDVCTVAAGPAAQCYNPVADGTVSCRAASCTPAPPSTPAFETLAATCTGGACPAAIVNACGGFPCNAGQTACANSCSSDAECAGTHYCAGGAGCLADQANGATCTRTEMCLSGNCVDGRCCNAPSCPSCRSCDNAGGTCATVISNQDDPPLCTGADTCDPGGTCRRKNGQTCTAGTDCSSGNCVDGTCCASASCAACRSCANAAGTCTTIITSADDPPTCTGTSTCDPSGSCLAKNGQTCTAGTQCASGDCVDGTCCASASCAACRSCANAAGTCTTVVTSADDPPACTGASTCDAGGSCLGKNGQACADPGDCASGSCVDGFCCNTVCAAQCEACDVAGSEGTCSPVSGAPHGSRPACAGDGSACNGVCDGVNAGSCFLAGGATLCRPKSCAGATATLEAFCQGTGDCPAVQTQACSPFLCGPSECLGNCTSDAQCVGTHYCSAGVCVSRLPNGQACSAPTQCVSGVCADGVCCNRTCTGQCEFCAGAGSAGICAPVTGAPQGGRPPCASDGSPCAGTCNGTLTSTCAYPAGVECRAASCDGATGMATLRALCGGNGTCPAQQQQDCAPFACAGTICSGGCTVDADCSIAQFCSAGTCQDRRANGAPCSTASQCVSGICMDGFCCDTACTGQCEACDASGAEGTCTPIVGSPHGIRTACASDASACAGSCDGTRRTSCTYPDGSVQCRAPSCAADVATLEAFCGGTGRCPPTQQQSCAPFSCGATLCNGNCTTTADCAAQEYCSAGICVPTLQPGAACATSSQCASGFCTDGVCCDAACTEQCEACDVPGLLGTCSAVTGAPRGGRSSCNGTGPCAGSCDGSNRASCAFPDASTACSTPTCSGDVSTPAASCNGAGTCVPGSSVTCVPYVCDATACRSTCVTASHCQSGFDCTAGACVLPPVDAGTDAPGEAGVDAAADAGTDAPATDATAGDTSAPDTGAAGAAPEGGAGSTGADAATDSGDAPRTIDGVDRGTCTCRAPGSSDRRLWPALALIVAAGASWRRRRSQQVA